VLRLTANDGALVGTDDVTVVASPRPNVAPVITSTPVTAAVAREPYSYTVTATDGDGDTPTFALVTAPSGMTIDAASGVIAWTPADGQVGDITVDRARKRRHHRLGAADLHYPCPAGQPAAGGRCVARCARHAADIGDAARHRHRRRQKHALTVAWSKADGRAR